MLKGICRLVCLREYTKQFLFQPLNRLILASFVMLDWLVCYLYLPFHSFGFWDLIITRLQIILLSFKLMCLSYLQHTSTHKCFYPWNVVYSLSLLGRWALDLSFINLNLIGRLVMAQYCSDLPLLCIDNLQHHAAKFAPAFGGKMDQVVRFHLRFVLNHNPLLNVCPVFHLKGYLRKTEPFRKESDGSQVFSLFLGNNRQHMPVCAKMISSSVRKVSGLPGYICLQDATISVA